MRRWVLLIAEQINQCQLELSSNQKTKTQLYQAIKSARHKFKEMEPAANRVSSNEFIYLLEQLEKKVRQISHHEQSRMLENPETRQTDENFVQKMRQHKKLVEERQFAEWGKEYKKKLQPQTQSIQTDRDGDMNINIQQKTCFSSATNTNQQKIINNANSTTQNASFKQNSRMSKSDDDFMKSIGLEPIQEQIMEHQKMLVQEKEKLSKNNQQKEKLFSEHSDSEDETDIDEMERFTIEKLEREAKLFLKESSKKEQLQDKIAQKVWKETLNDSVYPMVMNEEDSVEETMSLKEYLNKKDRMEYLKLVTKVRPVVDQEKETARQKGWDFIAQSQVSQNFQQNLQQQDHLKTNTQSKTSAETNKNVNDEEEKQFAKIKMINSIFKGKQKNYVSSLNKEKLLNEVDDDGHAKSITQKEDANEVSKQAQGTKQVEKGGSLKKSQAEIEDDETIEYLKQFRLDEQDLQKNQSKIEDFFKKQLSAQKISNDDNSTK